MSVPGVVLGVWDPRYNTAVAIDAEVLRLIALGTKTPVVVTKTLTIASGNSEGEVTVWEKDSQLVVKRLKFTVPSGVTITSIVLDIDGNTVTIDYADEVDLEEVFGSKVYGTVIKVKLVASAAVSSDTDITVKVYGYDAGKTQIPG